MKKNILVTEEEEREIIFNRAERCIINNLWDLQEKFKVDNFGPNQVEIKLVEKYEISVYYYSGAKRYRFTKRDMQENFRSLSEKIFNSILSSFKTISLYETNKEGARKLYSSYAFNVHSEKEAMLNDYTERDIAHALSAGAKRIEVVDFFSQRPLMILNIEFPSDEN